MAGLFAAHAASCDVPGSEVATSSDWLVDSFPADEATDVVRDVAFWVELDRYLLPRSLSRATVRLESGAVDELVFLRFDPVARRIEGRPSTAEPLQAHTRYDLIPEDLIDLDGNVLPESRTISFRTGGDFGTEPRPSREASWGRVGTLFAARCADADCHSGAEPRAGLDLSSPEGVRRTALGVLSRQHPSGSLAKPAPGALTLSGLPIVDVVGGRGSPASSYLLYKVLGDGPILGLPMPAEGPGLEPAELRLISDWILAGAPTE